ncbi:PH domain-containing protein [Pseudoxanthomonas dokdonensis]|uniref:Uncharacterized protein YyaB-like PH domain-containing protein n=1 Tax=Pseudoxanthomonas dokdonensis TaxID=344882 RepID=A0A0R0CEF6_9GAMM|nr:PH domain-containing protein [Pseudoxanthomonas dokdonensis]KRG68157.1 hypothetical protein ABB29_14005 [Pseudoxanthomonas dokdonensis]
MATTYRSKVDGWLLIVLLGAMAVCLPAAFAALAQEQGWVAWLTVAAVLLLGFGLPLSLLFATRYTITADCLQVRSGPFRWRVPLAAITDITPTRNPASSPALSLDRLRIDYGRGRQLLISPRDQAGFMQAIEQACRKAGAGR